MAGLLSLYNAHHGRMLYIDAPDLDEYSEASEVMLRSDADTHRQMLRDHAYLLDWRT